jgi:ABC-type transport system involved in multi-copper enzyme maturation permease subunit
MIFGVGPVLRYELITTARRGRYFVARLVYGLVLLYLLASQYARWEAELVMYAQIRGGIEAVRVFAETALLSFGMVQGMALLCLVPALVAGVIADEHDRKTLHYLLASRLSSAEIVLGKLGARLVHVGVFVAVGLPVVCLLALYGAINPVNVATVYGSTFTAVLFIAGVSILISTLARRPREAILVAYVLEFLWVVVPVFLAEHARNLGPPLQWVEPANDFVMLVNPIILWELMTQPYAGRWWGRDSWVSGFFPMGEAPLGWLILLQGCFGLLFLALAIAGLRPLRGSSWPGGEPRAGWFTRLSARVRSAANARAARLVSRNPMLASAPDRPACGDLPMLWKERYTSLGGGLKWLGSRPVMVVLAVLLGCYLIDVVGTAVASMYGTGWRGMSLARQGELNQELRTVSVLLAILGMLVVAAAAAMAVTGEREQDTWVSLGTTLLTPREVVLAKQFGAAWGARWVGLALLAIGGLGLLVGAIPPLGALAALLVAMIGAWFIAAVGVFVSSGAKNSTRALLTTLIVLIVVAWHLPFLLRASLASYPEAAGLWSGQGRVRYDPWSPFVDASGLSASVLILDAAAAAILTLWTVRRLRTPWGER